MICRYVLVGVLIVGPVECLLSGWPVHGSQQQSIVALTDSTALSSRRLTPAEILHNAEQSIVLVQASLADGTSAQGSGFMIDDAGTLVTNFHVIEGACSITVQVAGKATSRIRIVAMDPLRDLAILRAEGVETRGLSLSDSSHLTPGSRVVAVGYPLASVLGSKPTITDGLYSGKVDRGAGVTMLQISAPISDGSSGGPVFDEEGRVIGVSTESVVFLYAQNLNFAVPIELVRGYARDSTIDMNILCKDGRRSPTSWKPASDPRDERVALEQFKLLAESLTKRVEKSFGTRVSNDVVSRLRSDVIHPTYSFLVSWLEPAGVPAFNVSAVDPSFSVVSTFKGWLEVPIVEVRQKFRLRGTSPNFCNDLTYRECKEKGATSDAPGKQKREQSRLLWVMSYQEGTWTIHDFYASGKASDLLREISGKDSADAWRDILTGNK